MGFMHADAHLRPIEPGLLAVFRLLIGLRSVLLWLGLCLWMVDPAQRTMRLPVPGLIETTFLLIYLSWGGLRNRLGGVYLPLALIVASTGPFISFAINVAIRIRSGLTGQDLTSD